MIGLEEGPRASSGDQNEKTAAYGGGLFFTERGA